MSTKRPGKRTRVLTRLEKVNWLNISVLLLGAAFLLLFSSRTFADPDLWGHLRFGLDFLKRGALDRVDPYSYTALGQPWINHEWLSEVVFGLSYRALGPAGLILLKIALSFLIGAFLYWSLRKRGLAPVRALAVVGVSLLLVLGGIVAVRPQLFTYLAFAILLYLITRSEEGARRPLIAIPVLFALWANFHGGYLAGLAIALLWAATRTVVGLWPNASKGQDTGAPAKLAVAALLAGILATFLNPYGPELPAFLLRTATVPRPEISEWQPLSIGSRDGIFYLALLAVGIVALILTQRPRRPLTLLLFAGLALAPLVASRHAALFGLAVPLALGEHLTSAWERVRGGAQALQHNNRTGRITALAIVILALAVASFAVPQLGCLAVDNTWYPARAVEALARAGFSGNLAVHFNWGEYVIWHLGPDVKVSLDGRRETVYPQPIYLMAFNLAWGRDDWDRLLRDYPTDAVLLQDGDPGANLMRLYPGWTTIYKDEVGELFARDPNLLGDDRATADTLPRFGACFPTTMR